MRLYVARVIKGGLMAVVASFLLFECSDDSSKMGNPDNPNNPDHPDKSVIGKVILSESALAFYDILGGIGVEYTISLSQDLVAGKEVRVTLMSDTAALQISPETVTFTETTGKVAQTITVKRASDASDVIVVDITGVINHTIASVANSDPNLTTFQDGSTVDVTVSSTTTLADFDSNGLIEIKNATMLHNIRHDLAGASYRTSANGDGDSRGCPLVDPDDPTTRRCKGYELAVDIDLLSILDAKDSGIYDNDMIDMTTVTVAGKTHNVIDAGTGKDTSWVPIGDDTTKFTGIFEGNNHTIANLWVNGAFAHAGLFGTTDGAVEIRNVGVISGSVHSSISDYSYSGGLVGNSVGPLTLTIVNSYFSGSGGISSLCSSDSEGSFSGGLVGEVGSPLTIMNSYFSGSGGVSSSASAGGSVSYSGGLVGRGTNSLTIKNSYFSGSGEVSSSSSYSLVHSGGLVGQSNSLTIVNSYFSGSGRISSSGSRAGGLVGFSSSLAITNSYWNIDAPQSVNGVERMLLSDKRAQGNVGSSDSTALLGESGTVEVAGTTGLTLAQLKGISGTYPDELPHNATDNTKAWDLGTDMQLPAVKLCVPTIDTSATPPTTSWTMCASYGTLLAGQR